MWIDHIIEINRIIDRVFVGSNITEMFTHETWAEAPVESIGHRII